MRILYAGSVDLEREKGDTIHYRSLARAMAARGHNMTLVAFGSNDSVAANGLTIPQLESITLSKFSIPLFAKLGNDFQFAIVLLWIGLTARYKTAPFDLLYHRGVTFANLCSYLLQIPAVSEVNGIQVDEIESAGVAAWKLYFHKRREQLLVHKASRIICVTEGIRTQLVKRYNAPDNACIVIPNAADTDIFKPLKSERQEVQKMVGLEPRYYHAGFVGSFQSWVDFDCLLGAIKELQMIEEIRWTIVGDGLRYAEVQEKIERLGIAERINLVGRVPHDEIPTWCNAFDLCLAPFTLKRNDSIGVSPLKIYEYMACGRPIIATDLPGISEMFEEANAGLTYSAGSAKQLAIQVQQLYKDRQLAISMGKAGRDYAICNHSWHSVATRTEKLLLSLLNDNSGNKASLG